MIGLGSHHAAAGVRTEGVGAELPLGILGDPELDGAVPGIRVAALVAIAAAGSIGGVPFTLVRLAPAGRDEGGAAGLSAGAWG